MSALYAGASSLSFVGASDLKPHSAGFQAFYMFNSLVGMSVMSLVLTYVTQIYNAAKSRNELGLAIQTLSDVLWRARPRARRQRTRPTAAAAS